MILLLQLKELRIHNRKLFLCPPQKDVKTQTAFRAAIFQDKFKLWHVKLTIFIKKSKFSSYRQYLFALLFSEKPKKTRTHRPKYTTSFLLWRETINKLSKVATVKNIFPSPYVIGTTCFEKMFFIPCNNWKTVFRNSLSLPWCSF